jgi:hypothetical protein
MTSYVAIPNGDIDQDSPITQPLMTALRDNPIAIAEKDTSVPTGLRLGYWLLGTINTTSGTSQTLSGIVLTDYTALVLEVNDVTPNSLLTNYNLRLNSASGQQISGNYTGNSGDGWFGIVTIMLGNGVFSSTIAPAPTPPTSRSGDVWAGDANITNASTSITIALSSNSFTSGSILVYGVR